MVDLKTFTLSLPSFIEKSYFISPGVVSVIFKAIWSIFIFLVITLLVDCGLGAVAIKESKEKQKTIWNTYEHYSQVQSVSNGRWGSMLRNLRSKRVILGFLFWICIYVFEFLFSLSIDNAYLTIYNGTECVGRVDDLDMIRSTMWNKDIGYSESTPPKNITQIRELVNQKRAGNIALLGDGIFAISPADGLYKKNQAIKVARSGFNCDSNTTLHFKRFPGGFVYYQQPNGEQAISNISTKNCKSITSQDIGIIYAGYVNLRVVTLANYFPHAGPLLNDRFIFPVLVSNPRSGLSDINNAMYNGSIFLTECTLFFEHGLVTIQEDGYLNEDNIGESYTKVEDNAVDKAFLNSSIDYWMNGNDYVLSLSGYPNVFLDSSYNKTYLDTMKIANNIISAHLLSGMDSTADMCTFNQEQVPVYVSVLGTRMSFGYILIGMVFVIASMLILSVFSLMIFTKEERSRWFLYTRDWSFTGYISSGDDMDKNSFQTYAKSTYLKRNSTTETFDANEYDRSYSDSLLNKK